MWTVQDPSPLSKPTARPSQPTAAVPLIVTQPTTIQITSPPGKCRPSLQVKRGLSACLALALLLLVWPELGDSAPLRQPCETYTLQLDMQRGCTCMLAWQQLPPQRRLSCATLLDVR